MEEIKAAWVAMSLEKYKNEVSIKPGAREFLEAIASRGLPAGIATSNGREMVEAVLKSLDMEKYFHTVVTACEVAFGKPAPDIYLEAAKRLGAEPSKCWYLKMCLRGFWREKAQG